MKKYIIAPSLLALAVIISTATLVSAQVNTSNSISNAICPIGFICTKTKPVCPTGYICTPNADNYGDTKMQSTANTVSDTSGYVPGTWFSNFILSNDRSLIQSATPDTTLPGDAKAIADFLASTTANHTGLVTSGDTTLTSQGNVAGLKSAYVPSNKVIRDDQVWEQATNLPWSAYKTDQVTNYTTGQEAVLVTECRYPMTDDGARLLQSVLRKRGINADFLTDDSTLYATWTSSGYSAYLANIRVFPTRYDKVAPPGLSLARCLDAGYVSNYGQWSKYFANQLVHKTAPLATSSTPYNVSVNYDAFTAETKQYRYVSVFTSSGTKTVTITVFKFNDSPTMTAAAVIAKLAGLGFRPATMSELASLKAGNGIVGLGTNLGGSYGYPITGTGSNGSYNGQTGLGMSAGPFDTGSTMFAAVHN